MMLEFDITNQKLVRKDTNKLVNHTVKYVQATFDFKTSDWDDCTRFVMFTSEYGENYCQELPLSDTCNVPGQVLMGDFFRVTVYGVSGEERVTTNQLTIVLVRSGFSKVCIPYDEDLDSGGFVYEPVPVTVNPEVGETGFNDLVSDTVPVSITFTVGSDVFDLMFGTGDYVESVPEYDYYGIRHGGNGVDLYDLLSGDEWSISFVEGELVTIKLYPITITHNNDTYNWTFKLQINNNTPTEYISEVNDEYVTAALMRKRENHLNKITVTQGEPELNYTRLVRKWK